MRRYVLALAGLLLLGGLVVAGFHFFDSGAHKDVDINALFGSNNKPIALPLEPYVVPIMQQGRTVAFRTYRIEVVVGGNAGKNAFESAFPRIRDIYVRHLYDLTTGPVAAATEGRADPKAVERRLLAASQLALGGDVIRAVNVTEVSETKLQ